MLVLAEEEIASRTSSQSYFSNKGKEVVVEGLNHQDIGRRNEGILVSPRDRGSATKATHVPVVRSPRPSSTELLEIPSDYWKIFMALTTSTIEFPIGNLGAGVPTKRIPLVALLNFHGLVSEDPNTFLFEFDIVCLGYDYMTDA